MECVHCVSASTERPRAALTTTGIATAAGLFKSPMRSLRLAAAVAAAVAAALAVAAVEPAAPAVAPPAAAAAAAPPAAAPPAAAPLPAAAAAPPALDEHVGDDLYKLADAMLERCVGATRPAGGPPLRVHRRRARRARAHCRLRPPARPLPSQRPRGAGAFDGGGARVDAARHRHHPRRAAPHGGKPEGCQKRVGSDCGAPKR